MEVVGIVAEYNPFHNGHLYQIEMVRKMYKDALIAVVIPSSFCQRGCLSVLNKWDRTDIALNNGVDIVLELPFVYASQSADIFANGALKILNNIGCKKIVFGSEINNVDLLKDIAKFQVDNEVSNIVKEELSKGVNYPTALSNLIYKKFNIKISSPNDLLAISYIKEIIRNKYDLEPVSIKRTNDYHSVTTSGKIISATAIRDLIDKKKSIKKYVPFDPKKYKIYENTDYFELLKYKINCDKDILNKYQSVDEGIESRIIKYINVSNSTDELIANIKTKRYTYNRINRMLVHILTNLTKEECNDIRLNYIRLLGISSLGRKYLNGCKNSFDIPLITSYKNKNDKLLEIEKRVNTIYSIIVKDNSLIEREFKNPIVK